MVHQAQGEDAYHVAGTSHRIGSVAQAEHNFVVDLSAHLIECAVLLVICDPDHHNTQRDHAQTKAIDSQSATQELDSNNDQQYGSNSRHADAANSLIEVWRAWRHLS